MLLLCDFWRSLLIVLITSGIFLAVAQSPSKDSIHQDSNPLTNGCVKGDIKCASDPVGYEFISLLHARIDDDKDGGLDTEESTEFIRDDLKHTDSVSSRQKNLHAGDDHITVQDLWQLWVTSEVYNWTVSESVEWLVNVVELPQYSEAFIKNSVDGKALPRLTAVQSPLFTALGIKSAVYRQKLVIKATDLVLFGPPKFAHSYKKDVMLSVSVLVAVLGCYYAYTQQRAAHAQVQKVMKDLNSLQNAEDALTQLQQQLLTAQKEQEKVLSDKISLERQLRAEVEAEKAKAEKIRSMEPSNETTKEEASSEELNKVRLALLDAERRLEESSLVSMPELQQWLCRTYDTETRYFNEKRYSVEQELNTAKEMCDKIRKQKGKFLGSFRVAHSSSLDLTDQRIISVSLQGIMEIKQVLLIVVRTALEDVKMELQERTSRWRQIEHICGFSIIEGGGKVGAFSSPELSQSRNTLDKDEAECYTSQSDGQLTSGNQRVVFGCSDDDFDDDDAEQDDDENDEDDDDTESINAVHTTESSSLSNKSSEAAKHKKKFGLHKLLKTSKKHS